MSGAPKWFFNSFLVPRRGEVFALDDDLLLYVVPGTCFAGQAATNPLTRRGYSRDHRPDCTHGGRALVVTREGRLLGEEVFADDRTDTTAVEEIVGDDGSPPRARAAFLVMDRCITREEKEAGLATGQGLALSAFCAPSGINGRIGSRPPNLVCFSAHLFWKTLEQWQQRAGVDRGPRTILEALRTSQSTDVM